MSYLIHDSTGRVTGGDPSLDDVTKAAAQLEAGYVTREADGTVVYESRPYLELKAQREAEAAGAPDSEPTG